MRVVARRRLALAGLALLLAILGLAQALAAPRLQAQPAPGHPGADDWPMFLYGPDRQNWNTGEYALSPATAPYLQPKWKITIGTILAAAPAVVGDSVYIGGWDGYEYGLNAADGSVRWRTFLGTTGTSPQQCKPNAAGITSGAAVADGLVFVGGGADSFFALDAATGQPVWSFYTGQPQTGNQGGSYNWASPVVANGRVYSGIASFCDRPFVRGYMWGADAATGKNVQRAYMVPENRLGGGIWTSPTLDLAHQRAFVTTGSPSLADGYVDSIVSVSLDTFQLLDTWRVDLEDEVKDPDWSTTPTLFTLPDGREMVAAGNKNGRLYVFDANRLHDGPVWKYLVAESGECPQCGEGDLASPIYHDGVLYVGAGHTTIDGKEVRGSVRAFDAASGKVLWEHATTGPILASPAGANGVIVAAADNAVNVLDARDGHQLFIFGTPNTIWGAPVIAHGVIYVPTIGGQLYAYAVPPERIATPTPLASPTPTATATPTPPPALTPVAPGVISGTLYFSATGHTLAPPLRDYWQRYGGLAQFGYPLTEPFSETVTAGNDFTPTTYLVQYFERARFEYHPENAGTPSAVLLGLLGLQFHAPDPPAAQLTTPGTTYLNGHNLSGAFLTYWKAHGGLFVNGYPISEELDEVSPTDGKTYRVQYFERVRMEYHPEFAGTPQEVLLGLLGTQLLHARGWLP